MECERFAEEKVLLAHGEIGHQADFDAHFADCAGCRVDVEEMRDVRRRYHAASAETMTDALRERLLRMRPRVGRAAAWQRFAPLAAAAVLMVVLVIPMLRGGPPVPLDTMSEATYDKTVKEVRDRLPLVEPPRARPVEGSFDRELREIKKKKLTLTEDEW